MKYFFEISWWAAIFKDAVEDAPSFFFSDAFFTPFVEMIFKDDAAAMM